MLTLSLPNKLVIVFYSPDFILDCFFYDLVSEIAKLSWNHLICNQLL